MSESPRYTGPAAEVLRELVSETPFGGFAVLGNHDLSVSPPKVTAALEGAGIQVLRNSAGLVRVRGTSLWIVGIDETLLGRPDPNAAFAPVPAGDAAIGKRTGERQPTPTTMTIADGLRTALGELTWPVVRDLVDEIATVDEPAIVAAMRLAFERMKLVIEPSAAVGVAVALDESMCTRPGLSPMGVVLCGGNVDLDRLPWMKNGGA